MEPRTLCKGVDLDSANLRRSQLVEFEPDAPLYGFLPYSPECRRQNWVGAIDNARVYMR